MKFLVGKSSLFVVLLLGSALPLQASDVVSEVKRPQDQETCFSPDEPCAQKLWKHLEAAEKSIDVAIYDINLEPIVKLLIEKSKNMTVRMVVDKTQSKGVSSLVGNLVRNGVQVRYGHQKGVMHDKFGIVDGRMVETGSFNWTNHASLANQENQIYLENPEVVNRYQKRFEKIWEGGIVIDAHALSNS